MELIGFVSNYHYLTIIRAPRPFILIKVLKTFLKFELPKSQIKSILQLVDHECTYVEELSFFFSHLDVRVLRSIMSQCFFSSL